LILASEGLASVSRQVLEDVIGRAILDSEFRLKLFADPDSILAGYELTSAELAALKSIDAESLDACADGIGRRVLRTLVLTGPDACA
jgi:hypothetical protein